MAWCYPVYGLEQYHTLDIEPINENFLSVVGEVSGYLNEHNIQSFPTVSYTHLTLPTILRV